MPDLSGAPPSIGSSSKGKLQSQRGGGGRFDPTSRGGVRRGRGVGGRPGQGSASNNGQSKYAGPGTVNPQHPGHIPGSVASRPLNGIFAIDKPSGKTCMELLDALKDLMAFSPLFRNPDGSLPEGNGGQAWRPAGGKKHLKGRAAPPKVGQGGTLDPLASGVLVIGLGSGTKRLQAYLDCKKTYETTGLLGTATTSYDSQDPVMNRAPHSHVTEEMVRALLPYFTGPLLQYPPIYSACKMDGMRLFDYARQGIELPRPIEAREIEIVALECYQWLKAEEHPFTPPLKELTPEEKAMLGRVKAVVDQSGSRASNIGTVPAAGTTSPEEYAKLSGAPVHPTVSDEAASSGASVSLMSAAAIAPTDATAAVDNESSRPAAAFKLRMTVSGGTYVRSIVHDIGQACSSAAHVVALRRVRQGEWGLPLEKEADNTKLSGATDGSEHGSAEEAVPGAETKREALRGELLGGSVHSRPIEKGLVLEDKLVPTDEGSEAVHNVAPTAPATSPPAPAREAPSDPTAMAAVDAINASLASQPSSATAETLPCLPWSLFLSALEEQRQSMDPNARNNNRREPTEGKLDLDDLKIWERELLRVIQPC